MAEGTGKGITAASKITDRQSLRPNLRANCWPAIASRCWSRRSCPGREFTVGIAGHRPRGRVLGSMEVVLLPGAEAEVYSYVNKEQCEEFCRYQPGPAATRTRRSARPRRWPWPPTAPWAAATPAGSISAATPRGSPISWRSIPLAGLHPEHSDLPIICGLVGILRYDRTLIAATIVRGSALRRICGGTSPQTPNARSRAAAHARAILHPAVPPDATLGRPGLAGPGRGDRRGPGAVGPRGRAAALHAGPGRASAGTARAAAGVVFNLVESLDGADSLQYVPTALLDALGIRYTGAPTEAIFQTTHKLLAKQLLHLAGLPTPAWIVCGTRGT